MSILSHIKRVFSTPDEDIAALDEDWDHATGVYTSGEPGAWRWYALAGAILGLIFAAVRSLSPW